MSEGKKKIKVYLGIPSLGDRCDAQMYSLRDMEKYYADKVEFVYPKCFVGRIFHDYARNMVVEEFLATDCDVIWFLDSDIAPPNTAIELVTEHFDKWVVAGCPYPLFLKPAGHDIPKVVFAVYNDLGKGYHTAAVPKDGLDFVDGIATGCIFVKREVFEKLEKPYFEFKYDPETRELKEGEDIGFCKKVNKLGYRFFIDYSQTCHHFKKVNLLDVNNYCINEFNERWLEQDKFFRSQIAQLKLGLKKPKPKSNLILPEHLK
jgi:hypothetical protein